MIVIIALGFSFGAVACGKKDDSKDKPKPTKKIDAGTAAKKPAAIDAGAAKAAEDLPTEQDFEDDAKKEVTKKNLEKELKKIEKEVAE